MVDPSQLSVVLATDCGSTTTKAILFEKTPDGWRATFRGEAPTTVEKPVADVTIGALNAFREVEDLSGRSILASKPSVERSPFLSRSGASGIDLYVSTSSAGGGLQMVVLGVVAAMTTQSAERAALGAGAIVMDTVSIDDGREQHEHVERIRHIKPDIILIAGGTEGGTVDHPLELAETVLQADPRPRFGDTLRLPVIYAANSVARSQAESLLRERFEFVAVDNIRPALEREHLEPARHAIHEIFLNHVMSHAPGYDKLLRWSPVPILPTPGAVGDMVRVAAAKSGKQIIAVDIGGATTDVFSVCQGSDSPEPVFNRTVSANLGMSYSVANVLLEAGAENIERWLPFSPRDLRDRLRNKMIRPTSIPETLDDLLLEQAVCREALRLSFIHHKRLASGLRGIQRRRTIGDFFRQGADLQLIDMMRVDLIIGSGGVLSHAPDRRSAAFMLIDGYEPEGVTELAVDSVFMMPHLGVLASIHPEAAREIFFRDCLVELGTVVAPRGQAKQGAPLCTVQLGTGESITLHVGELIVRPLAKPSTIEITPLTGGIDIGNGPGRRLRREVRGGAVGLVLDGRGRPLVIPRDGEVRRRVIRSWYEAFELQTGGE